MFLGVVVGLIAVCLADPGPRDGIVNVHIICHSHDDVGWLKVGDAE